MAETTRDFIPLNNRFETPTRFRQVSFVGAKVPRQIA
jgi:hypothetical protein